MNTTALDPVLGRDLSQPTRGARPGWLPALWILLAAVAALLAAAGSVDGLVPAADIYSRETEALADRAGAQDLVNLLVVAPMLLVLGSHARRGHPGAYLAWLGCLGFTVYNYAIYAFSIHFGPLFLVWVGLLGLSVFGLLGGLLTSDTAAISASFGGRARGVPGWFAVVAASLFTPLWLSEILPDLVAHRPSTAAAEWDVHASPVRVLDPVLFLLSAAAAGVLLRRRHRWGYATAAVQLTFLGLTCLPIIVTLVVAYARGHQPGWAVRVPIGLMLLGSVTTLGWFLSAARPAGAGLQPLGSAEI